MREKLFKGDLPAQAYKLDEYGIPAVAYWNTEGDTPVYAEREAGKFAWHVWFLNDEQCMKLGVDTCPRA